MRTDIRRVIGRNARQARLDLGLTQEDVAARVGCDRAYISSLEMGTRNPTATTLWHLAEALKIEPAELLKLK